MSQRLVERMRETDLVARLGGDEFVIVLDQIGEAREAGQVAHQVIEVLSRPFELRGGQEVYTGASVGISVFPDDGDDAQKLLQQADAALYQAKGNGRGNYCFHTEALTQAAQRRLQMETRLRRALEHDELELHYQPLVDARSRRIIGLEVLARWFDASSGQMIPPSQFIPVAEETRLILRLGEWVLYQACWQMAQWVRVGLAPDIIAVNLSPIQFAQTDLPDKVGRILERTGLPGHRLELEITESALLDASLATERLTALKALGVRLAIDDFGTGYSSLSYLSRFPLDKLKVDQSFVRGIPADGTSTEIASVIVTMGHTLGLEVLAEGVETLEQEHFLIEHGCDTLQGWLFAKAVAVDQATELLRRGELPPEGHDTEPGALLSG
jgi:predicted signal transduction protein with EAL and GGDEF domain